MIWQAIVYRDSKRSCYWPRTSAPRSGLDNRKEGFKVTTRIGECRSIPLVVDLDGTLTPTDTLIESIFQLIKQSPLNLLKIPLWVLRGRSVLKAEVGARSRIDPSLLPYHPKLLEYLHDQRLAGRRIVLATAAHQSIAEGVAGHLKIFDKVLATDANVNLKGDAKLDLIRRHVSDDFVYAGDSTADFRIWKFASAAILVGASSSLTKRVRQQVQIEKEFPGAAANLGVWLKALRVHQWLKNLLVFVPLFTAFSFAEPAANINIALTVLAFFAFSLAASATYIVNDLFDLESDRAHPRKRLRPFANASIPILNGLSMAAALVVIAFGLAWFISSTFLLMLSFYVILTSVYSLRLKEYVLIDVLMLSILYTLRILAGSVAIGVSTTSWLLAFSIFIFGSSPG